MFFAFFSPFSVQYEFAHSRYLLRGNSYERAMLSPFHTVKKFQNNYPSKGDSQSLSYTIATFYPYEMEIQIPPYHGRLPIYRPYFHKKRAPPFLSMISALIYHSYKPPFCERCQWCYETCNWYTFAYYFVIPTLQVAGTFYRPQGGEWRSCITATTHSYMVSTIR